MTVAVFRIRSESFFHSHRFWDGFYFETAERFLTCVSALPTKELRIQSSQGLSIASNLKQQKIAACLFSDRSPSFHYIGTPLWYSLSKLPLNDLRDISP